MANCITKKLIATIQIVTDEDRGLLVVDFGVSPPGNWRNPHKTSVTPIIIESVIEKAIKEGWNPLTKGTQNISFPLKFTPDPQTPSPNARSDIRWDN